MAAISMPSSSLERDYCRRRLAHKRNLKTMFSDHHTREMTAKMACVLASYQLRVSEDWVGDTPTVSR
jgi:hypothetical protein